MKWAGWAVLAIVTAGVSANCGKDKQSQELTLLGLASIAAASSSCAGGAPDAVLVNSSGRSSNVYIFYAQTNCTGSTLATSSALNNGASTSLCIDGTSVGVKDQNGTGSCKSLSLFQGSKQTITHTVSGGTDTYDVVKASALLGYGGF